MQLTATIHTDELIKQCLQGEIKAYNEIYNRYCKAMFSTCYRIINHFTEAEDVLQDSFMDAFNNLKTFSYESTFGGWLKTIVINKSINHLKKKKLNLVDIDKVVTENLVDEYNINEEEVIYKIEEVKAAIQLLPDGYRTVLSLYLIEGYDHEEIAEIMQVATSTTRTQYMRANKNYYKYWLNKKDMSNNLKKFIDQNIDAFYEYQPSTKVWDKLQTDLKVNNIPLYQKAVVRKMNMYKWVAAASVILLISGGVFLLTQNNIKSVEPNIAKQNTQKNSLEGITKIDTPKNNINLPIIKEEKFIAKLPIQKEIPQQKPLKHKEDEEEMIAFNQSRAHFAKLIAYKGNEIKKLAINEPEVYKNFSKDINELNETYKHLTKQLPKTNDKSAVLNAMIYNLQIQMDLLNKQLIILNKIETLKKKKNYENNI